MWLGETDEVFPRITSWAVEAVLHFAPRAVIVQGGGDDLDEGVPVPVLLRRYKALYDQLEVRNAPTAPQRASHAMYDDCDMRTASRPYPWANPPRSVIFLAMPYLHKKDDATAQRQEFNEGLRSLFPKRTLEYHSTLLELGATCDGLHPDDRGDELMAGLVAQKVREVLSEAATD